MLIVNPTFARSAAGGEKVVTGPVDWKQDAIALFSNSKPNARELLEGIKQQLSGIRRTDNIEFIFKPSASQPAASVQYDEVARKYRAALLAIAD